MQWNARPIALVLALFAAGAARAQDSDPSLGTAAPHATAPLLTGEGRYDAVGYAAVQKMAPAALAASAELPAESYAEVTALDSGRTILVRIVATATTSGALAVLSEAAARQLAVDPGAPIAVRLRAVRPSAEDQAALRSAGAAQPRIDSPPALLRALRLQLPARPEIAAPLPPPPDPPADAAAPIAPSPAKPVTRAVLPPAKPAQARYLVQVAALSSPGRAQALAQKLHGFVKAGGGLYRVQLGPFATEAAAERARGEAVRAGFGDARRTSVR